LIWNQVELHTSQYAIDVREILFEDQNFHESSPKFCTSDLTQGLTTNRCSFYNFSLVQHVDANGDNLSHQAFQQWRLERTAMHKP